MEKAKGFNVYRNTYLKNDLAHGRNYEVEVGDFKRAREFQPQVKFKTFSNFGNFSVRLLDDDAQFKSVRADDRIRLEGKTKTIEFFNIGTDKFEFGVILEERPSDNKIHFSVLSKNYSFHYQPSEEYMRKTFGLDIYRPENIEHGYAVYCDDERKTLKSRFDFYNGKVFNIERPWAQDANNNRVWCDLKIEDGIMTITIPMDFYLNAKYPVFIDPTFGYSSIGASESTIPSEAHIFKASAFHYTASSDQEINYFKGYFRKTAGTCKIDLGVYDMGATNDVHNSTLTGSAYTIDILETGSLTEQSSIELGIALTNGNNYTVAMGNADFQAGVGKAYLDSYGANAMGRSSNIGPLAATYNEDRTSPSYIFTVWTETGNQPAAPVFSGTIPNYSDSRIIDVQIETASYFSETGTFTAANLPAGSSIDPVLGTINWADPTTGVYTNVSVTCTNGLGADTSNTFSITVIAQNPVFSGTVPDQVGNVSNPYFLDLRPYFQYDGTYSLQAGTLPTGLSINPLGYIDGTPTTIQTQTGIVIRTTNDDGSDDTNAFEIDIQAALPIPTITSVADLKRGESVVITGTNFEASQGAGFVTVDGLAVTETAWSDTSITITNVGDGVLIGGSVPVVVENNSGYNVTSNETYLPETGYDYVIMADNYINLPNNSIITNVAGYVGVTTGDRFVFQTAASPEGTVTHDTEGVPTITGATTGGDYTYQHYIQTSGDKLISPNGSSTITIETPLGGADIYPPVWSSSPTITAFDNDSVTVASTISETGSIYGGVILASTTTPSAAQLKSGLDGSGNPLVVALQSLNVTSATHVFTGLTGSTDYKVCTVSEDDETEPNLQASPVVLEFTTTADSDTTAPTFTVYPSVSNIQPYSVNFSAEMSEAGSIYYALVDSGSPTPSAQQIIDGYWESIEENPVDIHSSGSASIYQNATLTGFTDNSSFDIHVTAQDTAGNIASSVVTLTFTSLNATTVRYVTGRLVNYLTGLSSANLNLNYQIQSVWGEVSDSGTVTTDVNGNFVINNLTATLGTATIFFKDANTGQKVAQAEVEVKEL